ncbi:MAG: tyrosine-type recombinase/integrase [Planctomycetota bacterium]
MDFHALRHTYITNLVRGGIHPKLAMDLARHSDVNLTLGYYTHTFLSDRADALTNLPTLVEDYSRPQIKKHENIA